MATFNGQKIENPILEEAINMLRNGAELIDGVEERGTCFDDKKHARGFVVEIDGLMFQVEVRQLG